MGKNLFVFVGYDVFVDNESKGDSIRNIDFIVSGVTEGIGRSKNLFKQMQSDGFCITFITGRASYDILINMGLDDCSIIKFDSSVDIFLMINKEKPEMAILWNGTSAIDKILTCWFRSISCLVCYLEYGFFPQGGKIRMTTGGVLSWADNNLKDIYDKIEIDLMYDQLNNLRERFKSSTNQALLALQTDMDSSIVLGSPFPNMSDFVLYLKNNKFDFNSVVVRFHPKMPMNKRDDLRVSMGMPNIDESLPIDALKNYDLFIGVNSTLLYEAILLGKKVVNFGGMYCVEKDSQYSAVEFLIKGFDEVEWNASKLSRDKNIYLMYQYMQFDTNSSLKPEFIEYLNFLYLKLR